MGDFNVWSYLAKMGVTVRGPGHPDLKEGDQICRVNQPILLKLEDIEELLHVEYKRFSCQAPGCKETFSQLHESETHYNALHRHSCSVCRKSLPSPHLLELHLQEQHDSFFSVLAERKPSYQCFLPTCPHLSWSSKERHEHAIKEHKFPPDFRFDQVKRRQGSKGGKGVKSAQDGNRRPLSLARLGSNLQENITDGNKRSSICVVDSPESLPANGPLVKSPWSGTLPDVSSTENSGAELANLNLNGSGKKSRIPVLRSNSCRVPRNFSFGAGVPRAFNRPKTKHWHQGNGEPMDTTVNIEKVDLQQLKAALPT